MLVNLETIIAYKLPEKSREEIAAMFSFSDLKQTKFYQEVFTEGVQEGRQEGRQEGEYLAKVATIRRLVGLGLSLEVIAQGVEMSIKQVRSSLGE